MSEPAAPARHVVGSTYSAEISALGGRTFMEAKPIVAPSCRATATHGRVPSMVPSRISSHISVCRATVRRSSASSGTIPR